MSSERIPLVSPPDLITRPEAVSPSARNLLRAAMILLLVSFVILPELPLSSVVAIDPARGTIYHIIRGHATVKPFDLLWGVAGLRIIPLPFRILFALLTAGMMFFPFAPAEERAEGRLSGRRLPGSVRLIALMCIVTLALFILRFPYEVNRTFGDGATIPGDLWSGMLFPAEILTCYFFIGVRALASVMLPEFSYIDTVALSSCLVGGFFMGIIWFISGRLFHDRAVRWVLAGGLLLAGYSAMLFGYIETTQVELAAMMAFLGFVMLTLSEISPCNPERWEILSWISLSVALLAHGGGVVLLPVSIIFILWIPAGPADRLFQTARDTFSFRRMATVFLIVVVPYFVLLAEPFLLPGNTGNLSGGADKIMFVPLSFDYANPVSPLVSYSMFSWWHLADIGSALLVSAPLAFPLVWVTVLTLRKRITAPGIRDKRILLFLGIAAVSSLSIPLLWNHDWGMWGDWNITATYLFPLNLFAWVGFCIVHGRNGFTRRDLLGLCMPLIAVQLFAAFGLILQLVSIPSGL